MKRLHNREKKRPAALSFGTTLPMNRPATACLLVLLSTLAIGCESKVGYDLLFVDAATGRPIEGARFDASLWGHHFNNRLFPAGGKESAPPSAADGRTSVRLTEGDGLWHYFSAQRTGCHAITGQTSPWSATHHTSDILPSEVLDSEVVPASPGTPVVFKMRRLQPPR